MKLNFQQIVNISFLLASQDIKNRYRRSKIGPFWITVSTGVMIACISLVFGNLFGAPMEDFLPFVALGLIFWSFITGIFLDGCVSFVESQGLIKQLPLPLEIYVIRIILRNLLVLAHNLIIIPLLMLIYDFGTGLSSLLFFIGLFFVLFWTAPLVIIISVLCARYRDVTQIVSSMLQVAFYLTPIIWMPSLLSGRSSIFLLEINPFYHLISLIRLPLLGYFPSMISWLVILFTGLVSWVLAFFVLSRFRRHIVYWL